MLEVLHINQGQIVTLLLLSALIGFWSALTAIGMGLGSVSN